MVLSSAMPKSRKLLAVVWLVLAQGTTYAEPRKLSLSDLTEAQEKQLWERTDRYAGYAALLKRCSINVDFERRIRAEAQPCIEAGTLDQVATYFRRRYDYSSRIGTGNPCQDRYFIKNNLAEKLRLTLEDQIQAVKVLCTHYQRTGIFRSNQ